MKCPKCHAELPDNAKFCNRCGLSLQAERVCSRCQHANPPDSSFCLQCGQPLLPVQSPSLSPLQRPPVPTSFANGRYQVKKFLGEGGKKKVYLAHDTVLDRDVAFALIKTEKLDETARTRIVREAQAMGKLGDHPNIMTVHDMGEDKGQPYVVIPLMAGGDVEGLINKAPDHKLPIDQSIEIAKSVCKGLQFAHSKGIIHRDIKPGNVWLAADGTAKIGDFGLAVAIDLSRLTSEGMMVGTVSYMPPEQAMGGKVTARADLYSLGAMLYEMVTGRPPFVGDDPVAIIGQHINTPPVSPSWHRADLPPALETLIMQLLEKDPEKRPASATVVLQALESIAKGKAKNEKEESGKESALPGENPLYRRVFVGREAELRQLESAFDGAASGQGALMMVLGEPGIGKTALCEQLSTYVTLKGGRTLVGHCYEEGSLSLPYLAFVEAMRSYVLERDANDLRKELGSAASDVARIVSEIREKLDVKARQAENPEEERYRLMQSVTSFLTHAASVKPTLVVLEDLHDADKGSLEMLTYVSRNLGGARLLIVGTYRDVEVDRTHPLSAALAELRRVSTFGRVVLRGLNADEVRRMLESITRQSVPWSLAEAVHRQTEGNPLFVQEVVRFLVEQKLLVRSDGKTVAAGSTPAEMNIPEGLRDVIGKRLSLLSPQCNELLSVASVIGREFAIETLRAVANTSEEEFVAALKQAIHLSILEERSELGQARYRFTHAFFRQTLYEEMVAPERLKLHQQVARALETLYAKRLEEHASELAEHFSQSTDPVDLKKAVSYGEMAAKRATGVYAYGEAVRILQQVLKVQKVLDPEDRPKRCDLLIALGVALIGAGEYKRAVETEFPEALSLAEQMGDNQRAAQVCERASLAVGVSGPQAWTGQELRLWAGKADLYARPNTLERGWADMMLGTAKCFGGPRTEGLPLVQRALEEARGLGDAELLQYAGFMWMTFSVMPWSADETLRVAEELVTTGNLGRFSAFIGFLLCGQRQRAEDVAKILRQHASIAADARHIVYSLWADGTLAFIDGQLEECVQTASRIIELGKQTGFSDYFNVSAAWCAVRPILYLGKANERPESEPWRVVQAVLSTRVNAGFGTFVEAHLGRLNEANAGLERMLARRPGITSAEDVGLIYGDVQNLEAAVLAGHRKSAELLLERFASSSIRTTSIWWPTCIPRHLGSAAALLGRYDEARRHYQEAIRICKEMRFRPELALTRLQFAELLLGNFPDEKKEALEHLDFAVREFREMKMQPSLERALRRQESSVPASPPSQEKSEQTPASPSSQRPAPGLASLAETVIQAHGSSAPATTGIRIEDISPTAVEHVRVSLVQLDYSLEPISTEFGYRLGREDQASLKGKVISAIQVAYSEGTNVLCFPELCFEPAWMNEIHSIAGTEMIIVLGSYYESAANICPVIVSGKDYLLRKVNPSPDTEGEVAQGRGMACGREISVFQTRFGRFGVLVCLDFTREAARLSYHPPLSQHGVDFIVNPCHNSDTVNFQQQANMICQAPPGFPYVLQVNAASVNGRPGRSCIIGMEHDAALGRLEREGFRPKNDPIRYKLLEADGEMMLTATLDIRTKGVPVPARALKMRDVCRYSFRGDQWERL